MYSSYLHPETTPSLIDGLQRIIELVDAEPDNTVFDTSSANEDVLGTLLLKHGDNKFNPHDMWNTYSVYTKNVTELLTNIFGIYINDENLWLAFNYHYTDSIYTKDQAQVMDLFTSKLTHTNKFKITKQDWLLKANAVLSVLLFDDIKHMKEDMFK